jgi:hypothetical protein
MSVKSNAIPVASLGSLYVCEMLRIQYCLDSRFIDGGEVVSLTCRPRSISKKYYLIPISVRVLVNSGAIVRLEGMSKLTNFN